jgi:hypothetical protein
MFLILGCVYVFLEGLYFVINFLFKGWVALIEVNNVRKNAN